ncbi:MAG: calcium-binding protein [Alphaproteobacteria bacterium]|nr:calcium-binding protein [Alphaproteobacteria bacterium]
MPLENTTALLDQAETATGNDNPSVSVNLDGIADWSTQAPFLDITKSMRPWFVDTGDGIAFYDELGDVLDVDENGWLMSMPEGYDAVNTVWDWHNQGYAESAAEYRSGVYVLRYEGQGTIQLYGNTTIISQTDGEIVFENTTGGAMGFRILETDPNGTGDYLRDISVVKEEHLELFEAGGVFNPDWLELIDDMTVLRFMDWLNTNDTKLASWDDRPTPDMFSYMVDGAPIEIIVALGNQIGADIWVNVPHLADDDFVTNLATYIHENLDPDLQVSVEYGNEIWNSAFMAAHEVEQLAQDAYGDHINPFGGRLSYYGQRASEVMRLFTDVYGDDASEQLIRVAATQYVNTWVTERILTAPDWQEADPDNYVAPSTYFDAIAVTTYFGGAIPVTEELREMVIAAIEDPQVNAFDVLAAMLMDPNVDSSIPQVAASLAEQAAMAEAYGLRMVAYEGGQHVHHLFATDGSGLVLDDFLTDFARSEQMADLYQELFDMWRDVGGEAFMQFTDVGGPSQWGSWGLRATLEDTNPRAELLDALNAENDAWWQDRAGTHFQQGVHETGTDEDDTLIGTLQEDFLLGGSGNDILVGGKQNDGLHGGEGTDVALFRGSSEDYSITAVDGGILVEGPDGTDFLVDVEFAEFEDGVRVDLSGDQGTPDDPDDPADPDDPSGGDPDIPDPGTEPYYGDVIHQTTSDADAIVGSDDVIDAVDYRGGETGVVVDLQYGVSYGGASAGDTYLSVENVIGTEGHGTGKGDWLRGNDANNGLYGRSGNDALMGGLGADTLDGGEGWDYVSYGSAAVGIQLNLATQENHGGEAEGDVIVAVEGIRGTEFADQFTGGATDIYFDAAGGDDTIIGGNAELSTHGGSGADRFVFTAANLEHWMIVKDFNSADGDTLDLSQVLSAFDSTTDTLSDYLLVETLDWGTLVSVDTDGGGDDFITIGLIHGIAGNSDMQSLLDAGNLII